MQVKELTPDEKKKWLDDIKERVEAKRKELEGELDQEVTAFVYGVNPNEDDSAVLFLKQPSLSNLMKCMDQQEESKMTSGKLLVESCIIKEESDVRFLDPSPKWDKLKVSAYFFANSITTIYIDQAKKK
ncbi:hypothetical protein UFOVP1596_4 [uncultured Caudovirales phage]|uniref:Uncharacterized protein n=1 Tax=uncultured Caudovirales phage TaxID=2100421 RepID=A0A6J5STV2_9CAUD|nr:hypothetical protein UFOVP1596_4 [uncultured Caudovirales phage]